MRITLLISSLSGGGAERVVCNIANYLCIAGHDVEILSVADEKTYHVEYGVKHICMTGRLAKKLPHLLKNVCRAYKFNKYIRQSKRRDVILSFLPTLSVMLMKQHRYIHCPVILAERADPKQYEGKQLNDILNYYKLAQGFVFQTEEAMRYYRENRILGDYPYVIIPNAVNQDFKNISVSKNREKTIVGVGRLNRQKNFALLIRAFAKVLPGFPDYKLVIYGKGDEKEELEALAQSLGIGGNVEFPGFVKNIAESISSASLFVLSSDFEGMPNALAEAMALGLPCISTDCPAGGSRFLIDDGVNGRLVPVGDVDAMAKAIDEILSDPAKAKEMGDKACNVAVDLAPEKIYGQWEQFITEIVKLHKNKNPQK